jgi:signal peptidase I
MLRWGEHLFACIGVCFVLYHLAFESTVMTSDSMAPTLQGTSYENGDRILLEKVSGYFRAPRRWEIYFYYNSEGTPVAKRVVGLPGERISIRKNRIYINGTELEPPGQLREIKYYDYGELANGREVDCGHAYFMLGDASADSFDSRFTGLVMKNQFRGRAWLIAWPRAHFGFVR